MKKGSIVYSRLVHDIEYYFEKIHDIKLVGKQGDVAKSCIKNRHTVACFSRQSGKSTTISGCAVHELLFGKNVKIGVYGPTRETAIDVMFTYIRDVLESKPILAQQIKEIRKSGSITMHNGNRLRTFTASKDSKSVRGYDPNIIIIDESQSITDEKYDEDILPSGAALKGMNVSTGLNLANVVRTRIWEAGTPLGRNHFFDISQVAVSPEETDGEIPVIVYQPYTEYPYADVDFIEGRREVQPMKRWEQEYLCKWNLDTGYAFNWADVRGSCHLPIPDTFQRNSEGVYFAGIDLGRNRDHTVLSVFEYHKPIYKMVFHYKWDLHLSWNKIFTEIYHFLGQWQPILTLADKGGVGDVIFDSVFSQFPWDCEGWIYTVKSKADLIMNTQRLMERGNLSMFNHEELKEQFRILPEDRSPTTGIPIYKKPEKEHDDRVHSVVLGLMAGQIYIGDGEVNREIVSAAEISEFMKMLGPKKEKDTTHARHRHGSIWSASDPYGLGEPQFYDMGGFESPNTY